MISQIGSSLDSFKTLDLGPGLNLLLADKKYNSTDLQTRNGAGKSSLVELIHFLCGSRVGKTSIFGSSALNSYTFHAAVRILDSTVEVSRSGSNPNSIKIKGDVSNWPIQPTIGSDGKSLEFDNEAWKLFLGNVWYDLPVTADSSKESNYPSFRSLFSYFARRQHDGGFQNPIEYFSKQNLLSSQMSLCYLLGLDWTIPKRMSDLKSQEKVNQQLQKVSKTEIYGQYFGRMADVRTRLAIVEDEANIFREQLSSFKVVQEYEKLEEEANGLTSEINDLNAENVFDTSFLKELKTSLEEEDVPESEDVEKTYQEVGFEFPEKIKNRLENVKKFHAAVTENRRVHLSDEISSIEDRIKKRDERVLELDERRQQIMVMLSEGGALEHYNNLQNEAVRVESEAEELRNRLKLLEKFNSTKSELKIVREKLIKELIDDIRERKEFLREAILVFESLSKSLYEKAGSLKIFETDNGPRFEVEIDSQQSRGISNMQIFCFDLMLMILNHNRKRSPGILVHDSHLFDGVDERQIAKALEIGRKQAEDHGFQYLVTMNSDTVPYDCFSEGFDIGEYVMKTKLTDETETGGLFGMRF